MVCPFARDELTCDHTQANIGHSDIAGPVSNDNKASSPDQFYPKPKVLLVQHCFVLTGQESM